MTNHTRHHPPVAGHRRAATHRTGRIAAATAVAALLAAAPPSPADPTATAAAKTPKLGLDGALSRKSVIVTRCPINGGKATSVETTTTTYSYSFSGRSGRRGEIGTQGQHEYEASRVVEGVSDAVGTYSTGPTVRPLGDSATTFASAVKPGREGRGARARRVLRIDFGPIAGGVRLKKTVSMPKRGAPAELPIDERPPERNLEAGGGCTSTEQVTITGAVTIRTR